MGKSRYRICVVSNKGRCRSCTPRHALSKRDASVQTEKKKKRAGDKRNLYLLLEGAIRRDDAASEGLSSREMEKRESGLAQKRQKLKSPLFFIARTRLSVRNIGRNGNGLWKNVREGGAVIGQLFKTAAAVGMRNGNLSAEEVDDHKEALAKARTQNRSTSTSVRKDSMRNHSTSSSYFSRSKGDETRNVFESNTSDEIRVVSSVILVDKTRLGANGKPKSKGFGFVEFTHHAHALAALREVNNNPEYSKYASAHGRLIVDFAVENRSELIKQAKRRENKKKTLADARTRHYNSDVGLVGEGASSEKLRTLATQRSAKLTRAQRRKRAKVSASSAGASDRAATIASTAGTNSSVSSATNTNEKQKNQQRTRKGCTSSRSDAETAASARSMRREHSEEQAVERATRHFGDDLVRSQPERRQRVKKNKAAQEKEA